jgi:long-chain acyl-CoA synthetase
VSTLPTLLLEQARARPDAPAMREKRRGRWHELSWAGYAERVARAAQGLRALGVQPGDRVAILAGNRPEWPIADLAIQGIGAIAVGVYPSSPAAEVEYLLGHADAVVLVAEDEEQLDKALAVRGRLPSLRAIVLLDPRNVRAFDDPTVTTWEELERGGSLDDYASAVSRLDPAGIGAIAYTSGTTGPPKGAMLTHENLTWAAARFGAALGATPDEEVLSYLPLCHVAERLSSIAGSLATGYVVNFGEGGESFAQDLRDVQPTLFAAVPRVWEQMLATVEIRMGDASRLKRAAYRFALRRGRRLAPKRMQGRLGPGAWVVDAACRALVFRSLRGKLGLGRVRRALCGTAPVAPQVLEFFWALGVPVYASYGQTEDAGVCTLMPSGDVRVGTVGRPPDGVEVRIAGRGRGEILTRSPAVFAGYVDDPAATAAAIDPDGWLHTGDVGEIDEHGHLTITDRKEDLIVTASGRTVSPSQIENRLKRSPYVREAMVLADRRGHLMALIGIEGGTVGDWASRRGLALTSYGDLARAPEVHALVGECVAEVNAAQADPIERFALLEKELDHEDGELTATLQVRRRALERRFESQIARGVIA